MNSVFIASLIILLIAVSHISAVKNQNGLVDEAGSFQKPEGIVRKLIFLSIKTDKLLQLFSELKLVLRKVQNKAQMATNRRSKDFSSAKPSNYTVQNKSVASETRNPDPSTNTRNVGNTLSQFEYRPIIRQAFSTYKRNGCSKFQCPFILKKTADFVFGLCCSIGMTLVYFESMEEIKCVYQLLKEKNEKTEESENVFGTSYFDKYLNRSFTSCADREQPINPTLWALGEPDNYQNSEICSVVNICDCPKIGVHDVQCFSSSRYMCKYDPRIK